MSETQLSTDLNTESRRGASEVVRDYLRAQGRNAGLLVTIGVLVAIIASKRPDYISYDNFLVIALEMSFIMIAALGTAVLMIGGNIDLSIGAIFALSAVVTSLLVNHVGLPVALALGILTAGFVGLLNGILVWRIRLSPLIVTLGTMTLIKGVVLVLTNGYSIAGVDASLGALGARRLLGIPIPVVVALVLIPICAVMLHRTTYGLYTYAIGGGREASTLAGLNIRALVLGAFVVNGLLVGVAGTLAAARFGTANPTFGLGFELDVITAAILGGIAFTGGDGRIGGVVLAVMLLGVINSGLVWLEINPFYANVVKGGVLILAVALDQFSQEQRERYQKKLAMRER